MKTRNVVKLIAALLGVVFIGSCITTKVFYEKQFPRYERPNETITANLRYSDIQSDYPRLKLRFTSGKNLLQGYLYGGENNRSLMVIAHGLGGGADSYLSQIRHFVDQGFKVFAYDCTGSYDSEGKSTKGFPQSILDLHAALQFIESRSDLRSLPLVLFGHSWGGYAVAQVLNYEHDIKAVVSVSGVNKAMDIIIEHGCQSMGSFIYFQYPFLWIHQRLLFKTAASFDAVSGINKTGIPVLIIHGTKDELVDYNHSALIATRDEITNPSVRYISASEEGRNGHNNLFRSDEAINYIETVNDDYRVLFESYGGEIPLAKKQEFYARIDRNKVHALEPMFMQEIDAFLTDAIDR